MFVNTSCNAILMADLKEVEGAHPTLPSKILNLR
jgi:hypothetical protein